MTWAELERLSSGVPELQLVVDELRLGALREHVGRDPLLAASVPTEHLDRFLSAAARAADDAAVHSVAMAAARCVAQRGVGQHALEICRDRGVLAPSQVATLQQPALGMSRFGGEGDVVTRHRRSVAATGDNTALYHSFLVENVAELARVAPDELGLLVLDPARGPASYTLDCLALVLEHAPDPAPYQRRWVQWIEQGCFDAPEGPGTQWAGHVYDYLHDHRSDARFDAVREVFVGHLLQVLRSEELTPQAWHLLYGAVSSRDMDHAELLSTLRAARILVTPYQREALLPLLRAISARHRTQRLNDISRETHEVLMAGLGAVAPSPPASRPPGEEVSRDYLLPPPAPVQSTTSERESGGPRWWRSFREFFGL